LAAIRNLKANVIEYSHSAGMESLRRKMVEYYKRHQITVDYQDILITTGGSEAITITLLTCLNAGDEILVPEPFYANYFSFATSTDVNVVAISSHIEDGFALLLFLNLRIKLLTGHAVLSYAIQTTRRVMFIPGKSLNKFVILY
jgi:aspartate aminotransferase